MFVTNCKHTDELESTDDENENEKTQVSEEQNCLQQQQYEEEEEEGEDIDSQSEGEYEPEEGNNNSLLRIMGNESFLPSLERVIDPAEVVEAILRGLEKGEKEFGITVRGILQCIRYHPDWADEVVTLAWKYKDWGIGKPGKLKEKVCTSVRLVADKNTTFLLQKRVINGPFWLQK